MYFYVLLNNIYLCATFLISCSPSSRRKKRNATVNRSKSFIIIHVVFISQTLSTWLTNLDVSFVNSHTIHTLKMFSVFIFPSKDNRINKHIFISLNWHVEQISFFSLKLTYRPVSTLSGKTPHLTGNKKIKINKLYTILCAKFLFYHRKYTQFWLSPCVSPLFLTLSKHTSS